MAEGELLPIQVRGLGALNSRAIPSLVQDNQVTTLENMVPGKDGYEIRLGCEEFKDNTQWTDAAVIHGVGYKLDDADAEVAFFIEDGRIFYQTVDNISDNPTVTFNPTETYDEVAGFGGGDPLTVTDVDKVFVEVLNNKVFAIDGGNFIRYYGDDHVLHTVPDPAGFEISMTVSAAVAATLDATYFDAGTPSRTFNIEVTKVGGTGTTLTLRQTGGDTRPSATGTLTKATGTGDASIAWTAVAYSDNYVALGLRAGRLVAMTDAGFQFISGPNNGTDFTGAQAEYLEYGKQDGLKVTNATAFKRGMVLSLTEPKLQKGATAILTGYRKFDTNTPERIDGLFKTDRESDMLSIFGRSGREIGEGFIGLTKKGFVSFSALDSNPEFGITDNAFISDDIRNIIKQIDFRYGGKFRSSIDENNHRYWCAVTTKGAIENNLVLVYDFGQSHQANRNSPADHRWSLFTFNFGTRTITSTFTIFGHPFLGLSDGTVVICEVEGHYLDIDTVYRSGLVSKYFDHGVRLKRKKLKRGIVDLLIDETTVLETYAIADGNAQTIDYGGKLIKKRKIVPRDIAQGDVWSAEDTDVWSYNPFDVWGRFTSDRYTMTFTNVPLYHELAIAVYNTTGGSYWGVYGYELLSTADTNYTDSRLAQSISRVLSNPAVSALLMWLPELTLVGASMCYNI